ncbi:hypothetical protein O181_090180 [Austropuccinia psidii MF-1]|uniref:Uncharacterized protein n=1 Tax=Austropuccinia psidii MF-1 TaxID=1389203 RepID=A0A9Q3IVB0_9BASI|nr:hypothetical protein [Austropuccinia psidii MF-1]
MGNSLYVWGSSSTPRRRESFNACLLLFDRYSKTPVWLACHEDDTAMKTAIIIWNISISNKGCFQNVIRDRDPELTSGIQTNLHSLFGTKLSLKTAHNPQTDGIAAITIQTPEDNVRRFCPYGLYFKYSLCFTHDWCTLIPALELK